MKPPDAPTYTDADMGYWVRQLIEMCGEALPDDMRVCVIVVDGSELKNRRLRTRMMSNMGTKMTEKVLTTTGRDLDQVIPVKKHYAIHIEGGRIGFK
jgi:hypothetical protein